MKSTRHLMCRVIWSLCFPTAIATGILGASQPNSVSHSLFDLFSHRPWWTFAWVRPWNKKGSAHCIDRPEFAYGGTTQKVRKIMKAMLRRHILEMLHREKQKDFRKPCRWRSEKWQHCYKPVGHRAAAELSTLMGGGGGWKDFEG